MTKLKLFLAMFAFTVLTTLTAFASGWYSDATGWRVASQYGTTVVSAWVIDTTRGPGEWYGIDQYGTMISTPFFQTSDGKYYVTHNANDGRYGMIESSNGTYYNIYCEFALTPDGPASLSNPEAIQAFIATFGEPIVHNLTNREIIAPVANTEDAIINNFLATYIHEGMSDFEKEMTIIRWLVQNYHYSLDYFTDKNAAMRKNLFLDGESVCKGYADAFKKIGDRCGLTSVVITGQGNGISGWGAHAWNQICLNGNWYNLDVTWEDPLMLHDGTWGIDNGYGFNKLWNRFINVPDAQFSQDHSWSGGYSCTATEFGHDTVAQYLASIGSK